MPMRLLALSLVAPAILFACTGCRSAKQEPVTQESDGCQLVSSGFGPAGQVPVHAEIVATGLEVPWGLAFLPGGDVLITERPGRIRLMQNGQLLPAPVAQIPVGEKGEGGLMGLALHPDFATNRLFFIAFTADQTGTATNRVERWRLSEDHRSAALDKVLLEGILAAKFHDGGRVRIGPDGMLYVSMGDATKPPQAQDPNSPNGKILRITLDGEVPQDNPFPGSPAWLIGVRNSQGFDWKNNDTMYLVDHGPSGEFGRQGHDEVNVATKGANLGWPDIFGCQSREGMVTPALTWEQAVPPGGAAIYTGSEIADWRGSLLLGTLGSRHLHRVVFGPDGRTVASHEVYFQGDPPQGFGRLRETIMGPDGHLWVTTSNCDSRGDCPKDKDMILRIRAGAAGP